MTASRLDPGIVPRTLALVLALALPLAAFADLFRCTDAAGEVSYAEAACPGAAEVSLIARTPDGKLDDAAWAREADAIRQSDRPLRAKAEQLARLAVASRDVERIRQVVREIEGLELAAQDKLSLQTQLQEQDRRLRAGQPTRVPDLDYRPMPRRNIAAPVPSRPFAIVPAPGPAPTPVPPAPPAAPRPGVIVSEDGTGAWTSDGRRLLRQGPLYVDPGTGERCLSTGTLCVPQ